MKTTSELRDSFLNYFAKADHKVMPSSSLVPHNDPTLMFSNAGMNQFKDIFTGKQTPPHPRAASSQKCVRAGGKHNDLDNVGYTARHHTFFEMLGNFSFGDYFKEDAIKHAWQLLHHEWGIPAEKLFFTVYHTDDEAYDIWKQVTGCDESRILRIPTKDNFWEMGPVGPCGPCSEIFYDHGADAAEGAWELDADGNDLFGDRFIEIWNLVFMQYEQVDAETRVDLPNPCVDTGMGLERMAAVMQGKHNNYDIDLFAHLIGAIENNTQAATSETIASHRVIADHLRSCGFLIADGVLPSNEGRGYVLRRIMRRAMRHAHHLGASEPLMHKLVPALLKEMGGAYPELQRAEALMTQTLEREEKQFKKLLDRGLKLLDEALPDVKDNTLDGEIAFKLYDTYGFPLDLTEDIMRGKEMRVDQAGFDAAMAEQKARARAAWSGSGEDATGKIWFEVLEEVGSTEFLGYSQGIAQGEVLAIVKDGARVDALKTGEKGQLITNQTPFYGESGGQMGDSGTLYVSELHFAQVNDTTKPLPQLHAHHVAVKHGEIKVGDAVTLDVDEARRDRIRANHSATHLLHEALRRVLGEHVTQKGSLVAPDRLRFDISQPEAITPEQIEAVEKEVNALIWKNSAVSTELMDKDAAIEAGAKAMFGEKYDEEVRVLSMGADDEAFYSVELCGGTHVKQTGDIGLLKIISESAIASGVRRIEALTGADALNYLNTRDGLVRDAAAALKVKADEVAARVAALQEEKRALEKELAEAKKQLALGGGSGGGVEVEMIASKAGQIGFVGASYEGLEPKELRGIANEMLAKAEQGVVVVASNFEGKASLVVAVGDNFTETFDAPTLVRAACEEVGGKGGGGKPNMAQAGGPNGGDVKKAVDKVRALVAA